MVSHSHLIYVLTNATEGQTAGTVAGLGAWHTVRSSRLQPGSLMPVVTPGSVPANFTAARVVRVDNATAAPGFFIPSIEVRARPA